LKSLEWISVGVGVLVDFGVILEGDFSIIFGVIFAVGIIALNQGRA
jgi:hypothetical protein